MDYIFFQNYGLNTELALSKHIYKAQSTVRWNIYLLRETLLVFIFIFYFHMQKAKTGIKPSGILNS